CKQLRLLATKLQYALRSFHKIVKPNCNFSSGSKALEVNKTFWMIVFFVASCMLAGLATLLLPAIACAQSADEHAPAAAEPAPSTTEDEANKNFFRRFYDAYREELRGSDETPSPSRI